jgi:hypothetical protein
VQQVHLVKATQAEGNSLAVAAEVAEQAPLDQIMHPLVTAEQVAQAYRLIHLGVLRQAQDKT